MKTLEQINDEAVKFALHQCRKYDQLTWGDFDSYHNDYVYNEAQKEGLSLEKQCKTTSKNVKKSNQRSHDTTWTDKV